MITMSTENWAFINKNRVLQHAVKNMSEKCVIIVCLGIFYIKHELHDSYSKVFSCIEKI